jgi:hypothetical protein
MITSNKRSELQRDFANLTDYSAKCPKGCRSFFAFVAFEDGSANSLTACRISLA